MEKILGYWKALDSQRRKRIIAGGLILAIVVGAWYSNANKPEPQIVKETSSVRIQSEFQVHVTGAVQQPGLYKLDAGARVQEAIAAAGGLAEGAVESSINLARLLSDGEQILVLHESQLGSAPGQYLSLNQATAEQLEELPGIGPSTANKILEYRNQIGSFSTVDQLLEVPGIGTKLFKQIQDQLTL